MSAHLYIEGGESKEDQIRCREGFRKLLEKSGFEGRMPRLSACGGRNTAFDDFKTAHANAKSGHWVAMLIDSEDPVTDLEEPWEHLKGRDNWDRPEGAENHQVLFMTTCMETWIVADRETLKAHYGHKLHLNSLPPANNLEQRNRHEVQEKLERATKECTNAYRKGKRSFEVLGALNPSALIGSDSLRPLMPSFARMRQILADKL